MADINNVEKEELYGSLFADTGTRQPIDIKDWKNGWSAIVGGVNGIPTSTQFNTLQYITDVKCYLLWQTIEELRKELAELKEKIESGVIGTVDPGGFVLIGSINTKTNKNDLVFIIDSDEEDTNKETSGGYIFAGTSMEGMAQGDILFVISGLITGEKGGMAYVGSADKSVRLNSILFITSGEETPVMKYAAYSNMAIGTSAPNVPNWGFVNGKLTVAEIPESDTKFFAKL